MDASEGIDGRKRAALALLGLRRSDRQWLLAQLPDGERAGIVAMLGELERMKLPPPPQQIAVAADALKADRTEPRLAPEPDEVQPFAPSAAALHAPGDERQQALARLSAATAHRALRDEPNAVIARVGALADWPWAAELSSRLGPARAAAVARLRDEAVALPAAVANALLDALATRAQACAGDGEAGFAAELRVATASVLPPANPSNGQRWWKRRHA
jgi:hypothetical protein